MHKLKYKQEEQKFTKTYNVHILKGILKYKILTIIVLIGILGYIIPTISSLFTIDISNLSIFNNPDFHSALLRTIMFSGIASIITVLISFLIALSINRLSIHSRYRTLLSIFLFPLLLGNVAVAYLFKSVLYNTEFFDFIIISGSFQQFILLGIIHLWQYSFIFIYLFWLNNQTSSKAITVFAIAHKLNWWDKFKSIYLPHSQNLFILLFVLSFIFSIYEDAKSRFIFKVSAGLKTEQVNSFLMRTYHSDLLTNPEYAFAKTILISISIFLCLILFYWLFASGLNSIISKGNTFLHNIISNFSLIPKRNKRKKSLLIFLFLLLFLIIPFLLFLLKVSQPNLNIEPELLKSILLTATAAIVATLMALVFSILARLAYIKLLVGFNNKSLLFFSAILLLALLPPILLMLSGFKWLSFFHNQSQWLIQFVWVLSQTILLFPILSTFLIATHFAVNNNEMSFYKAHNIPFRNILSIGFFKRFPLEYLLTFFFAFILIWNEGLINIVFSDYIPSFASIFEMSFIGRGINVGISLTYFIVSVLLSGICVIIWNIVLTKGIKLKTI